MTFTAKHKASGRYGVVNEKDEWLEDFLGTKEEAQAKADELNKNAQVNSVVATDSASDVDNSGADKPEEAEQNQEQKAEESDKGLDETEEEATHARAPFVSEDQSDDSAVVTKNTEQEAQTASGKAAKGNKRFVLTKQGWIAK